MVNARELRKCTSKAREKEQQSENSKNTKTHACTRQQRKKKERKGLSLCVTSPSVHFGSVQRIAQFSEWIFGFCNRKQRSLSYIHSYRGLPSFHSISGPLQERSLVCGAAFYFFEMAIIKSISPTLHIAFIIYFSLLFHCGFLCFIHLVSINIHIPCTWWIVLIILHFYVFNLIYQLFHRKIYATFIDICRFICAILWYYYTYILLLRFEFFLIL